MNQERVRISCEYYFDEELIDYKRIRDVMEKIEAGDIERTEFVLEFPTHSNKPSVVVDAVIRQPGKVEGWLAYESVKGAHDLVVYCVMKEVTRFVDVVISGLPQKIDSSAILTTSEAADLLESLAKGELTSQFKKGSHRAVIRYNN